MAIIGARLVNAKAIENALVKAFEQWAEQDINEKHWDKQFKDMSKWPWTFKGNNDVTVRENPIKDPVTTPRDIDDWGNLYNSGYNSYKFTPRVSAAVASWHWDAKNSSGEEYAGYVHDGTKFMDGRPFTEDIAVEASFFFKEPGQDLEARVQSALDLLSR